MPDGDKRMRWALAGVLLLAGAGSMYAGIRSEDVDPIREIGRRVVAEQAAKEAAAPERVLPVRKGGATGLVDDPVLDALAPRLTHLRCPAPGLELGAYDTRPAENHVADVLEDGLHIAVPDGSGSAWLERDVRAVAQVRWAGEACEVVPVELVPVRGTLTWADGSPAVDHAVRGCIHGEFARTDDAGGWELQAVAGTTCHPMAFVEAEDGRFGKSNVVGVEVVAPGPVDGVALELPAEDSWWTPEEQREMAGQLGMMMRKMTERRRVRLADLRESADGLSGDDQARAAALVDRESAFLTRVDIELDRLDDPDEQQAALRDAWLSLN